MAALALGVSLVADVAPAAAQTQVDYDSDDDQLIDISSLAQLNAMRWDLDGDGAADRQGFNARYAAAFPTPAATMGCPTKCLGYELSGNLDFDTDSSGDANSSDTYWNGGKGWEPVGTSLAPFSATFDGKNNKVSHLFIARGRDHMGLFGYLESGAVVRNVVVEDAEVRSGGRFVGALVGWSHGGTVTGSSSSGSVSGRRSVGGLVGSNLGGTVTVSSSAAAVSASAGYAGGLVGSNSAGGSVAAAYATGSVNGPDTVGALVGWHSGGGVVEAAYSTGAVTGDTNVGGLIGRRGLRGTGAEMARVSVSYWATAFSGRTFRDGSVGKTSAELAAPTGYTGIYANWNIDLDGDGTDDAPWNFGTGSDLPKLKQTALSGPVQVDSMADAADVVVVPADWALIPTDPDDSSKLVSPGGQFRLMFVTKAMAQATSIKIADYNAFVQKQAKNNAGFVAADGTNFADRFRVVGSTASVDARDNTGTTHTADSPGVPIYWVNGKRVADTYARLWSTTQNWESSPTTGNSQYITFEDGTADTGTPRRIWTGTDGDGTEAARELGDSPNVVYGQAYAGARSDNQAIDELRVGNAARTLSYSFYALSPVLEVSIANAAPVFTGGVSVSRLVDENTAADQAVGAAIAATDRDEGDTLTYSLSSGGDNAAFAIDSTSGQILTKAALNYEAKSSYAVTVNVTDCKTSAGAAESAGSCTVDASIIVAINVNNMDEPGAVTFGSATPQVGTALTAALADPDGGVTGVTWAWTRLDAAGSATGTTLTGATSASYTPVSADSGKWLRATASYTDAIAAGKTATGVTANPANTAIVVSENALTVAEDGGTDTYTVKLAMQPTGDVTVTVSSSDTSAATVSGALTFTAVNWNAAQSVTVTGVDDDLDNAGDERAATITHEASGGGLTSSSAAGSVSVTVTDDDTRGVTVTGSPLSVAEDGGTATYSVVLDSKPTGSVTVTPASSDTSAATVSGALTFTVSNWRVAQDVTVTGVDDDFDNAGDQRSVTVSHTVSGGDYGDVAAADVAVSVSDDDTAAVVVSEDALTVSEADLASTSSVREDQATYTVKLATEPTGDVTVMVSSSDTDAATVSAAVLTFEPDDWNVAQTVTVTGVNDSVSTARTATISHEASGGGYTSATAAGSVAVTVADDDAAAVVLSPVSVSVAEDGGTAVYTVRLATRPSARVQVRPSSGDTTAATVRPAVIRFTRNNWSTAQTVTVTGVDDDVDNASDRRSVTVSHTVSGGDYGSVTAGSVSVSVTDDDTRGVTVTGSPLSVAEDGGTETYSVVLDSKPTGSVTVTPASSDTTAATVSGALTFTVSNWSVAQSVTVTGVNDDVDNASDRRSVTVTHTVSGGDYGSVSASSVSVTVTDDDGQADANEAPVFTSSAAVSVAENTTAVVTVAASDADSADSVTGYAVTGGADRAKFEITSPGGALAFRAAPDFEDPGDVLSSSPSNAANNNEYVVEVTVTAGTGGRALTAAQTIVVTVTDANEAPVFTSSSAVSVAENTTAVVTVAASDADSADSIVSYAVTGGADRSKFEITSPGGALSFAAAPDFESPGDVSSSDPSNAAGNNEYVVEVTATAGAGGRAMTAAQTIVVTVTDANDAPTFTSSAAVSVVENTTAVATVAASDADSADSVTGYAVTGGADRAKFEITSPGGVLSFRAAPDFESPGDVLSTSPANAATNNEYVVVVTATGGTGGRALTAAQTIVVTVTDANEAPAFTSAATASVAENTTAVATVAASDVDSADSVTGYAISGGADRSKFEITSPGGVLSFRAAPDFESPGDVLSTSPANAATNNEYVVVVTVTAGAGGRALMAAQTIVVTVTDANDPPAFTSDAAVSVAENTTAVVTVAASDADSADSVTGYAITGGADRAKFTITSPGGALVFAAAPDFEDPDDVSSSDPSNAAGNNEYVVEVTVTAGAGGRALMAAQTIVVTVTDSNEAPAFTSAATASVAENTTAVVTVAASDVDSADSVTGYAISGGADRAKFEITSPGGVLSFRAAPDFESPGDVLSSSPSNAANNNEYVVEVTATAGTGDRALTTAQTIVVTVTDVNEAPAFTSAATASVAENTTAVVTVAASDADSADSVTGYAISGGADRAKFEITSGGVLSFRAAPDFESPGDVLSSSPSNAANNNEYVVEVTATAGAGGRALTAAQTIVVTVTDANEVTVTPASVSVAEDGGTQTYSVVLDSRPTGSVTVTPASSDTTAATVSGALTFTVSNWNMAQTVTVTGVNDDLDNAGNRRSVTVTNAVSGGDYGSVVAGSVAVTVNDDDTRGVTVTPASVSVAEADLSSTNLVREDQATYTVVLDSEPTGSVTVTPASGDVSAATVSGALTFTVSNWNVVQTVTVTGVDDDLDNAGNRRSVTVTNAVSGGDYGSVVAGSVSVSVTDDDTRGVTVTGSPLSVAEADVSSTSSVREDQATYTVVLDSKPTGSVTVTPASGDATAATVSGALTFTVSNWNVAQTVTVTGVDDDVDNASDRRSVTVSHTVSGGDYGSVTASSVSVSVTDDDTRGVTVTGSPLSVAEADLSSTSSVREDQATYTVVLDSEPTGSVTVTPASGDVSAATVSGALTFTVSNWSVAQTVTVTGVNDDVDNASNRRSVTVTHTVSGGDYATVVAGSVSVSVTDDDTRGVTVTGSPLSVAEADVSSTNLVREDQATYTVVLDSKPTGSVTVTPASSDASAASVSGALTFTVSNWSVAQSVTVTGVDDDVDNASNRRSVTVTHTVSGGDYGTVSAGSVSVSVTDDDTRGVTVTPASVSVAEADVSSTNLVREDQATYTVVLDSEPTGSVTVTPASGDASAASVSGALTFTVSNWSVAQTVTVTGVNDDLDNASDRRSVTVTNGVSGGDYGSVVAGSVSVIVTDDDTRGVTVSGSPLSVAEDGGTETYTVVLDSKPTGSVTVTPASGDASAATVSGALTFTVSNWNVAQTVTVTGVDDDLDNASDRRSVTVTHTVSGGDYGTVTASSVSVSVTDDDTRGVTVTGSPLSVAEADVSSTSSVREDQATYTVVLDSKPTGSVTVTPASGDASAATVSGALTFTVSNWNVAQTVTVTGVNDDLDNTGNRRSVTVTHTVSGGDYGTVSAASVTVAVNDDDGRGVTVTPASVSVAEDGGTQTYSVVLDSKPTASVTVTPASGDASAATVSGALTFTVSNWNVAQSVTVTGVDDDVDNAGNRRSVTVTHTVSGGDYATLMAGSVSVSVTDDDTRGVTVTGSPLSVAEDGGTATYSVVLDSRPTGSVTVTPASGDASAATVSGALTFTVSNWSVAQTVTVTGVDDDVDNAGNRRSVTVTNAVSGGDYGSVSAGSVSVSVTDDDTRGVTVSGSPLSVTEDGGTQTYSVVLDSKPTGSVTVTPASGDVSAATVSGALTFTVSNWSTAQTVTVTGVDDDVDNAGDERSVTVTHTVSGGDYASVSAPSVAVTVTDDDTQLVSGEPVEVMASSTEKLVTDRGGGEIVRVVVTATDLAVTVERRSIDEVPTVVVEIAEGAQVRVPVTADTSDFNAAISEDTPEIDEAVAVLLPSAYSPRAVTYAVDISVTGQNLVTVCMATDSPGRASLVHFADGAWSAVPGRTIVDGKVCGEVSSFSPFAVALRRPVTRPPTRPPTGPADADDAIPEVPFTDVGEAPAVHRDDIARVYGLGLITGTSATTYSPGGFVTRAQMASFLARLYGVLARVDAAVVEVPFADLGEAPAVHRDDIARVYGLGLTTGTSATTYSPGGFVTRAQMASFLARLYGVLARVDAAVVEVPFADLGEAPAVHRDDIARVYGLGLTTGTSATTYSPGGLVTRAQMASFLARLHRLETTR